jgi:hypothetical protein
VSQLNRDNKVKMSLKINIDVAAIAAQFKEFALELEQDLRKGVANLAAITHAKVVENAQQELHSSRQTFMDNLGFEEISPGIWVISIDQGAMWIEEGIEANKDMKPDLLKNAKTSSKGVQYKVIPFDEGKAPSQMTPYAQGVVARIKQNLKKQDVPFKKIEFNSDGSPRVGKLHEFDFGGEKPGKGNTPVMKGVSIYQSVTKTGNVRRDILTFRTVSNGPESAGKWVHPGYDAKKYLDKAADWAMNEWEQSILPEVLSKWNK